MRVLRAGLNDEAFERWLIEARSSKSSIGPQEIAECLLAIENDSLLTGVEKQDRAHRLLVFLRARPEDIIEAWRLVGSRASSLTGSVIAILPAHLKQAALSLAAGRTDSSQSLVVVVEQESPSPPVKTLTLGSDSDPSYDRVLVILIGDVNEFGATMGLLGNNQIAYKLCADLQDATEDDRLHACAVIIGRSMYAHLTGVQQHDLLRTAVRWNSQTWVKFGYEGLDRQLQGDIVALTESLGFTRRRAESIHISERSELTQGDLGVIVPYARQVEASLDCSLLIDGLSAQQCTLVASAVKQELVHASLGHLMTTSISVQSAHGRSSSTILICRVAGCGYPFILRLGSRSGLLEGTYAELPKIVQLILPWNPQLLPSVYSIGDDAVLVYKSIRKTEAPESAATTLAGYLELIQAGEPPDPPNSLPSDSKLKAAIDAAFAELSSLNRMQGEGDPQSFEFILEHYLRMAEIGKSIQLGQVSETLLEDHLRKALDIIGSTGVKAIAHGDPHTKNIVLPTQSHAELIDFERVHVGHPLYDTCHFAVSITATSFRTYTSFERIADHFYDCLFGTSPEVQGVPCSSIVNGIVAHSLLAARKTAADLSEHYGLATSAFPAMMLTVSTFVLMYLPQLQTESTKAILVAAVRRLDEQSRPSTPIC